MFEGINILFILYVVKISLTVIVLKSSEVLFKWFIPVVCEKVAL